VANAGDTDKSTATTITAESTKIEALCFLKKDSSIFLLFSIISHLRLLGKHSFYHVLRKTIDRFAKSCSQTAPNDV
jgi:hypothetical protein